MFLPLTTDEGEKLREATGILATWVPNIKDEPVSDPTKIVPSGPMVGPEGSLETVLLHSCVPVGSNASKVLSEQK